MCPGLEKLARQREEDAKAEWGGRLLSLNPSFNNKRKTEQREHGHYIIRQRFKLWMMNLDCLCWCKNMLHSKILPQLCPFLQSTSKIAIYNSKESTSVQCGPCKNRAVREWHSSKLKPKQAMSIFIFTADVSLKTKSFSTHECDKNPINPSSK